MSIDNETSKTHAKMEAIAAFQRHENISSLAQRLGVTRATLYRWKKKSESEFSRPSVRRRQNTDMQSRLKILEVYFVLRKPSCQALSRFLREQFAIQKTPSQLRRLLIKWQVQEFEPSASVDSYLELKGFSRQP